MRSNFFSSPLTVLAGLVAAIGVVLIAVAFLFSPETTQNSNGNNDTSAEQTQTTAARPWCREGDNVIARSDTWSRMIHLRDGRQLSWRAPDGTFSEFGVVEVMLLNKDFETVAETRVGKTRMGETFSVDFPHNITANYAKFRAVEEAPVCVRFKECRQGVACTVE